MRQAQTLRLKQHTCAQKDTPMDKLLKLKENLSKLFLDPESSRDVAAEMLRQRAREYCMGVMDTWTNEELRDATVQKTADTQAKPLYNNGHKPSKR
jgi:hypothetical protein